MTRETEDKIGDWVKGIGLLTLVGLLVWQGIRFVWDMIAQAWDTLAHAGRDGKIIELMSAIIILIAVSVGVVILVKIVKMFRRAK